MFGNKEEDKTKSIIGLVIFGIFVLFVAIISRTGNKNDGGTTSLDEFIKNNKEGSSSSVEEKMKEAKENTDKITIFSGIEDENYEFTYTINDNGDKTIYSGKVNGNKMVVDVINRGTTRYYKVGDTYLDSKANTLEGNPLKYSELVDAENLRRLYNLSITREDNGVLKSELSAYDIIDIYFINYGIDPFNIDEIDDSNMEIYLANSLISKAHMDFSKAVSYMNNNKSTFEVTLEYSSYGRVDEINIG